MQVSARQGGTREFAEAAALNPNVSFTFRHFQALSNELVVAKVLRCPADKQRTAAQDFASLGNTNVSYWVNVGAAFGGTDSPIVGDRNVRTSGRTEWTFLQIAPGDAVEFSAELHGNRGNVLFGDGHVSLLDGAMLRSVFEANGGSNSSDTTLSLPRQDVDESSSAKTFENADARGSDAGSSAANSSNGPPADLPTPRGNQDSGRDRAASNGTTSSVFPPTSSGAGATRRSPAGKESPLIYTLLDGTVVTSSVLRHVTNAAATSGGVPGEVIFPGNPLLEFAEWLARQAAGYTYWLLLLLLAALIAFELARRRAGRKRRRSTEE